MAAFCRFYGLTPDDYWNLKLDEHRVMREYLVAATEGGG